MVAFSAPGQTAPGLAYPFTPAVDGGAVPAAPVPPGRYHVVLDGQGYLIDPSTYRRRPAARLAPKTRTGDEAYGDFVNGSAWSQSSWADGFGFEEWDKSKNTQLADSSGVDTSRGDLRPGRPATVNSPSIWQYATYQGELYGIDGGTSTVWKFDAVGGGATGVVSLTTISPCGSLRSIAVSNQGGTSPYLFVGAGDSGKIFRFDGTTWILWATIPGASAVRALAHAPGVQTLPGSTGPPPGTLLAGAANTTSTFASGATSVLTAFYADGTATTGPNAVAVGLWPTIEAIYSTGTDVYWSAGNLALGEGELLLTQRPIYSGSVTTRVTRQADNIVTCFVEYAGKLLAGSHTRGRIWTVEPSGITEFFHVPEIARPGNPPMYAQPMRQMVVTDNRLYVPMLDVQGLSAYQFDGQGWCRINVPISGHTTPYGLGFAGNALFLAGDGGGYFLPASYVAGGTAVTPWFDADLPTLSKGLMRVTLAHSVLQTGEAIVVAYAVDDVPTWTSLGMAAGAGTSTTILAFPGGVVGKRFRLRFMFLLTSTTHGQRLRSFIAEYNLTSDVVAGDPLGEPPTADHVKQEFAMEVLLEGTFEHPLICLDRSVEPKTGDQLRRALWATKAKQSAVAYEDVDGQQYTLWFSDLEDRLVKEHARPEQGWRGTVRLTEE